MTTGADYILASLQALACAACGSASKAWPDAMRSTAKPAPAPASELACRLPTRTRHADVRRVGHGDGMTTVVVVDDHPIVLQGCRRMLEDAGVEVILEARDAITGYKLCRRHRPDVAIVDLAMQDGGLSGLPLIRRIRTYDARVRILVFSMHSDPIIVARALEAGACGYVLKDTSSEDFLKAFKAVVASGAYLSHDLALQVALVRTP